MYYRSKSLAGRARGTFSFRLPMLCSVPTVLWLVVECIQASDWPQFLGPTRNGVYSASDLAASWPPGGPAVLWQRSVGEGFSGPVVAQGRVVLFHRVRDRETVECLDADTGQLIWSFAYPTSYVDDYGGGNGTRATPAIAGDRVVTFGAQGVLHCLDFATGEKIWRVDTHSRFAVPKGFFGAACSPLVAGDRVLMNIGGTRRGAGVVAFDKSTGKVLWTATNDEAGYSSPVTATIGGRDRALFFTRSGLVDVDPETGRVQFQFRWRARSNTTVNAATPLVIGEKIFLSASSRTGAVLLELRGNRPEKLWSSDEVLSNHYATSVYHDGHLYGFHGRQEYGPSLRCAELETGKLRWSQKGFGAGTLLVAGDRLLILREDGRLFLAPASPRGFRPTAEARVLSGTVRAYPALANGRLYARDGSQLVCLDLRK